MKLLKILILITGLMTSNIILASEKSEVSAGFKYSSFGAYARNSIRKASSDEPLPRIPSPNSITKGWEKNKYGWTLLHELCNSSHPQSADRMKSYLHDKALSLDPSAKNNLNLTPLHILAFPLSREEQTEEQIYKKINLLLEAGASIDEFDCNGNTPLHLALKKGSFFVSKVLIKKGANVKLRTCSSNKDTMIFCALKDTNYEDEQVLFLCELLINAGAEINKRTTALIARYSKDRPLLKDILKI